MAALVVSGGASADSFHYKNLIPGDRAVGLGGAYVALASDTSAGYYNPAGLVDSKESASGTVNVVAGSRTRFSNVFPNGGGLRESSTGLLPGFVGLVKRLDDRQSIGFSLVTTDYLSEQRGGDFAFGLARPVPGSPMPAVGLKQAFISEDLSSGTYEAGPSYARRLDSHWTVGTTLTLRYQSFRNTTVVDSTAVYPGSEGTYYFQYGDSSFRQTDRAFILVPTLGLTYRDGPINLGLTIRHALSLHRRFSYDYNGLATLDIYNADDTSPVAATTTLPTRQRIRSGDAERQPVQFSLGGAYQFRNSVISTQFDYFTRASHGLKYGNEVDPDNDPLSPTLSQPSQIPRKAVFNAAIAFETAVTPRWKARAAFFTDISNVSAGNIGTVERREVVNLLGIAASATYTSRRQQVSFGAYASEGRGVGTLGDLGQVATTNGNPDGRFPLRKLNINAFVSYDFSALLN